MDSLFARRLSAILLFSATVLSQSKPARAGGDIVGDLLQVYPPRVMGLSPAEKSEAAPKLEVELRSAAGKRRQAISFLLAALGSNYRKNRDYLVAALGGCSVHNPECDADTAGFLIMLYEQGHHEVLHALIVAGPRSDGALSEGLGTVCGKALTETPTEFVADLRHLGASSRKTVCFLAGSADGGGTRPETLQGMRQGLRRMGDFAGRRTTPNRSEPSGLTG